MTPPQPPSRAPAGSPHSGHLDQGAPKHVVHVTVPGPSPDTTPATTAPAPAANANDTRSRGACREAQPDLPGRAQTQHGLDAAWAIAQVPHERLPRALLLDADPDWAQVSRYLPQAVCLAALRTPFAPQPDAASPHRLLRPTGATTSPTTSTRAPDDTVWGLCVLRPPAIAAGPLSDADTGRLSASEATGSDVGVG